MKDFSKFEEGLGIYFENKGLLMQAFIHRSYLNEHSDTGLDHNERLEFLGDAVLELIVTEYLYNKYDNPEGDLTSWRAALVNSKMLSKIASDLNFNEYILLSKGEAKDTGRARQYILANAVESIIGAIYLDKGFETAKEFITKNIIKELPAVLKNKLYRDPKSTFQEQAQDRVGITPTYGVIEESGPDHDRHFVVGVYLEEELVAEGGGSSKQEAQEGAAQKALEVKGW
ncbi:MAG: ribonuclease III [Candidatus Spechtbacteria bacterium RIFCSPLOWO2_12_FULL_38_22]|uniref:Ribonuclease 3 n=1 Tax=Candidatus Spechtbacteria bacterium RIFCSPLOWO2_12_FULL_38_22 TaxID=1802165 RepID=A0A1G2HGT7_9BACT|nr:MAG: ribonuclease III [Candidatus Spechtbacteria bacterium RIFCSPHIGHO2_01_FULL_38_11]OGZ59562.1 MAG: ribonuclease III [Candidatus Spechtbacteria bacterium RIFCSPHIGHO2_12_FULL_38_30]OGZ60524.1 MAG: ribonuclease III [Candidatus Spechtbacteria bacterium RIFCSPLOWO2_01_FULL_38_20]OGZ61480.1 MAG: ribonuclease III [Candidatus Spechtbacteria bacterium RIFCSPLOWO2_12_FULL_38_22]